MENFIICGGSRSGKSNLIKQIVLKSILSGAIVFFQDYKKGLTLKAFNGYVAYSGQSDGDFFHLMHILDSYYNNRVDLLYSSPFDNWQDYVRVYGEKYFKEIIVVVEELQLSDNVKKVNDRLINILNVCNCVRISFVISTQRCDNDIISTKLRTNCEIIAFGLVNQNDYKLLGVPIDYEFSEYIGLNPRTMVECSCELLDTKTINLKLKNAPKGLY